MRIQKLTKRDIDKFKQYFVNDKYLNVHSPLFNKTTEEFEWQFFDEDYNNSVYYEAIDDNSEKLIGTLAGLLFPMLTPNGEICNTIKPEDTLINVRMIAKYPYRDILKELFDAIDNDKIAEENKFYWGFTEAVSSFERLGFSMEFYSLQGVLVFNPYFSYKHLVSLNSSNGYKQKMLIMGLSFLAYFKGILQKHKCKNINCKEISFDSVDENLLLSFLPSKKYCLHLNKEFLKWRILKNPSNLKYHILQFENDSNEIISYLIYSVKNESVYFIEQFLFSRNLTIKIKQDIVYQAMGFLKNKKAKIVRTMGFEHNEINKEECSILKKSGFIYAKKGIPFIFKSKDKINSNEIYLSRLNTQGTF